MRVLALAVLLAAAPAAQAQLFKCVDAKGRTHYTDKPLPGCKGGPAEIKPPPPSATETQAKQEKARRAAEKKKPDAQRAQLDAQEKAQLAGRCQGLRQEEAWLSKSQAENRDIRLGQVRQALRACP